MRKNKKHNRLPNREIIRHAVSLMSQICDDPKVALELEASKESFTRLELDYECLTIEYEALLTRHASLQENYRLLKMFVKDYDLSYTIKDSPEE